MTFWTGLQDHRIRH